MISQRLWPIPELRSIAYYNYRKNSTVPSFVMNVFVLTLCLAFGVCLIGDCNAESEGYSKPDFCTDAIMDQDCRALGIQEVCARGQTYSNLCILCLVCERDHMNVLSYTEGECK